MSCPGCAAPTRHTFDSATFALVASNVTHETGCPMYALGPEAITPRWLAELADEHSAAGLLATRNAEAQR